MLALWIVIAVHLIVGPGSSPPLVEAAGSVDEPPVAVTPEDANDARSLLQMLNEERARAGIGALTWNDQLAAAAQKHAQLMAEHKQLTHEFPGEPPLQQRLAGTNLRLDRSGENVSFDSTIAGAHQGFMHSPLHRENMLNPKYNDAGIGLVHRGDFYYITEDFAHVLPVMSDAEAQSALQNSFAELRRSAGERLLTPVDNAGARELACSMARNEQLDTRRALALPGARYAVAYTASEPAKLSSDVVNLRSARDVDRYALGLCFARTQKYPNGVYWILMVFFAPGRDSSA